ncbi:MAG: hypothetical protein SFY69_05745 [Planctomycetota bacterium]|nr:hypothetical protein [Planctomycetota bacterium]
MKSWGISAGVVAAAAILLAGAAGLGSVKRHFKIVLRKEAIYPEGGRLLASLPTETPSWVRIGSDHLEPPEVVETLGTRNYVTRTYIEKAPKDPTRPIRLTFHAAYYTGMIDTVPHVPDRCFVGGGMQIGEIVGDLPLNFSEEWWREDPDVPEHLKGRIFRVRTSDGQYPRLPRDPRSIRLRTMQFLDAQQRPFYAGYFFIANGGTVSRAEEVRLLAFDLNSTYAFYLKVQVTSQDVESGEDLAAAGGVLIGEMLGDIARCAPDWVEVETGRYPPRADGVAGGS